ncbi:hypothetical protein J6590_013656 [Homalodisca vitripennis]|nr:hypothetical protein J6590_013656 [Homalodisca vitripennis]
MHAIVQLAERVEISLGQTSGQLKADLLRRQIAGIHLLSVHVFTEEMFRDFMVLNYSAARAMCLPCGVRGSGRLNSRLVDVDVQLNRAMRATRLPNSCLLE